MKKILMFLCCFFVFTTNILALEINSSNAVVYNLNEDEIVFEKNSNEVISIASLTKIMTTIVAIENIKNLDEKVTIKSRDFVTLYEEGASLAGFEVGQTVTYRDLLYGTFLPSGAEATQALAFNLTGSIESFVELMNQKATEIGLTNTHFANTTGLDNKDNYSTVVDVAKLLKYALKNDIFKEIYETNSYTTSDEKMTFYSSFRYTAKKYGYDVSSLIGAKTGYTDDAGKCLASTAYDEKNDIYYMSVTCGASTDTSDAYHIKDNVLLYNYFFDNYKYQTIIDKNELLVSLKTKYGKEKYASFYAKEPLLKYLDNSFDKNKIILSYSGLKEIGPTTNKDKPIGKIDIFYDKNLIDTIDITLDNEYQFSLINYLLQTKLIYVLIIIIIFFIFHKRKKTHKRVSHRH